MKMHLIDTATPEFTLCGEYWLIHDVQVCNDWKISTCKKCNKAKGIETIDTIKG